MDKDYSGAFIYKPRINGEPPLQEEYGSSQPVRFFIADPNKTEVYCASCEAQNHIRTLEDLDLTDPDCFERMKETLIFILENIDWPSGD